jgi:hypothetical protein
MANRSETSSSCTSGPLAGPLGGHALPCARPSRGLARVRESIGGLVVAGGNTCNLAGDGSLPGGPAEPNESTAGAAIAECSILLLSCCSRCCCAGRVDSTSATQCKGDKLLPLLLLPLPLLQPLLLRCTSKVNGTCCEDRREAVHALCPSPLQFKKL